MCTRMEPALIRCTVSCIPSITLLSAFTLVPDHTASLSMLQENSNDVLGIDPDVRQLVYTQAVANGGAASYNIMQELYLSVSFMLFT